MKRLFILILTAISLVSMLSVTGFANEENETVITCFEDGSYLVETMEISNSRASGTKTGTKTQTYYGSSGSTEWKVILTGTFNYTGSSATCTASSVSVTIYDSNWYAVSKSASKSGATASATVIMGYKSLGITTNKVTATPTLTCDANGNLF